MYFWKEIGIKQVYICPDLNYGAAIHADKWIPVLPNTDAALQLAIAYTLDHRGHLRQGVCRDPRGRLRQVRRLRAGQGRRHSQDSRMGRDKCGVPEWTIKALAREFARKVTSIAHYFGGGYVRGPYSHEPARLEVCLLGMQGLGKPGVHQHQLAYFGMPRMEGLTGTSFWNPEILERLALPVLSSVANWQESVLPKTLVHKALKSEEPLKFMGTGAIEAGVKSQFKEFQFPIATSEGSRIRMIWTDTPCRITCWNGGNETEEALRSAEVETIVAQHPWLENDCLFADLILPANTHMEVDDIVTNIRQGGQFATVILCDKAVEPVGESMSDFQIVLEIAKKLGYEQQVSEGVTTEDIQKKVFEYMHLGKMTSWEEFREKGYYLYQAAEDWEDDPAGFQKFASTIRRTTRWEPPRRSWNSIRESLAKHFPDDLERRPVPGWVEKSAMHDERISSHRSKDFPLLLMSNHGRWRVHSQCDDITWTREAPTCKITGHDGYKYEPIWLHTSEAAKRGIKHGDIIKILQ